MYRHLRIMLVMVIIVGLVWPTTLAWAQDGQTLLDEGYTLLGAGDPAGALEHFEAALERFKEAEDLHGQGDAYGSIGAVYFELEQYDQAVVNLQEALDIYREIGERVGEADVLNMLGWVYNTLGDYEQALSYYLEALPIYVEVGELAGEGDVRQNIGMAYYNLGRFDEALTAYQQLLQRKRETGASWEDAFIFHGMGMVYAELEEYDQALASYEQALDIFREADAQENIASVLQGMGWIYLNQAQYTPALEVFTEALDIFRTVDNQWEAAATLAGIAEVYASLGQYDQAVSYLVQVLEIAQELGDWNWAGETYLGLGEIFFALGRYDEALRIYQQAQELYHAVGEPWWEAVAIRGMAATYQAMGQPDQALTFFQQALEIALDLGDRSSEADALSSIGSILYAQGDYAQALDYHLLALEVYQETNNRPGEADALTNIGTVYYELGQSVEALDYYEQAVVILAEVNRPNQVAILGILGWLYEDQGMSEEAIARYAQAVDLIESIQADIRLRSGQVAFAGQAANVLPYDRLVTLLAARNPAVAFNYAERARARSFLYQIGNEQLTFGEGAAAELMDQWQAKRDELTALYEARLALSTMPNPDPEEINQLLRDIGRVELELAQLEDQITLQNPTLHQFTRVDVPDLATIQAAIPAGTTMLVYYVTDVQVFAFILTRSNLNVIPLQVTSAQLYEQVVALSTAMYARDAAGNFILPEEEPQIAPLQQLHTWLYVPLKDALATTNLIVVPHDVLNYLPFAALTADGEHYLLDDFVISYVPSAAVYVTLAGAEPMATGTPLVLAALPPEYATERGAQIVADQLGVDVLLGDKATESLLREQIGQADIVHLAAHGHFDRSNPLSSFIALSPDAVNDGMLEVREIYTLSLHEQRPLVVLSSCETATGQLSAGDEFQGLTRAFLASGAREVIASLWLANDYATAVLLVEFYGLRDLGFSEPEALALAQRKLVHVYAESEDFPSEWHAPYFWAMLVLNGVAQ